MADERTQVHFYGGEEGLQPESEDGRLTCKFVLVSDTASLHLVFGPVSRFPYHAGLLERFCGEREITCGWLQRPDLLEIYGDSYQVLGGGYIDLDLAQRTVSIGGQSKAYGACDHAAVGRIVDSHEYFSGFSWTVE